MITDSLNNLTQQVKNSYQENRLLFISSIFIPLIAPLFFYCPTSVLRTIFYISIPFLIALLFKNRHELKQLISQDKITWGVLTIFVLFMSASVLWSDNGESVRYFSKGKLFLLLGLTTVSTFYITYKYPKFSSILRNCYILGATSSALVLIANYLATHGFAFDTTRLEGMGRASNPVQASLMYGLALIAITFAKFPDRLQASKIYLLKAALILPNLVVIFLTQSRGPFLALLATMVALFILRSKNKLKITIATTAAAILLAAPCYSILQQTNILDRKTTGRFEIWETSVKQIMEKPIIGNGLGIANRYTYTQDNGTVMVASHIHSLYLSTAFQGGLIGLGLLLSIYFLFAKRFWSLIKNGTQDHLWIGGWVLMGAAFGITDFGGIIINLSTEWLVFWWPIAFALGHLAYQKQSQSATIHPQ